MSDVAPAQKTAHLLSAFNKAMNTYDVSALAICFATDAEFTNVAGKRATGRIEIAKAHEALFASKQTPGVPSFYGSLFEVESSTVRFIKPDVAVIDINWKQIGTTGPDGQPWPPRKGLINTVAVEHNGEWLFVVFHNMVIQ
ncbi:SgcJ/EcaC family oxidoreductase [Mucilaginibacter pedocola]|nr:SgcJ/EcaC family oxidoreductase [Mucilaginibacter pedocola]